MKAANHRSSFYSKFCRDQKVSLPQHADTPSIEVHHPEASSEGLQYLPNNNNNNNKIKYNHRLHDGDLLEGEKANDHQLLPFHDLVDKISDGDEEELVYVEESQPTLPAPLIDNVSLKYTSNGDQCTLGEVAEKVMEINVDDPYDLCSLLVAEKKLSPTDVVSGRRRRKMLLSNNINNNKLVRRNKSFVSTMLPKSKDGRTGGKSQVCKYPFKCSRCDSWFVDSVDLKIHMSTHKEKSFKSVKDFIHEKIFKKTEIDRVGNPPPPTAPPATQSRYIKAHTPPPPQPQVLVETIVKKESAPHSPPAHHQISVSQLQPKVERHYAPPESQPLHQHHQHRRISPPLPIPPPPPQTELVTVPMTGARIQYVTEYMVPCSLCHLKFRTLDDLQIHMQIHKDKDDSYKAGMQSSANPYKCASCPATFGTSFNLKRHMRIHTGTRPYKCNECHAAFITKAQLTTHMRTHTGEKPYKCHICGGKFIQQNNLKRHIMTHTGEKPFKCDKCTAAFISSSDLKRHIRVHTGEKPYKCLHCNKGFTTSGNLSSHYKMHTGEKPYRCHLCSASFSHQSNLKTHIKRHITPFRCACGASFSSQPDLARHSTDCKVASDVAALDMHVDENNSS